MKSYNFGLKKWIRLYDNIQAISFVLPSAAYMLSSFSVALSQSIASAWVAYYRLLCLCLRFGRCAQQHTLSFKSHKFWFYTIRGGVTINSSTPLLLTCARFGHKNLMCVFFFLSFFHLNIVFMLISWLNSFWSFISCWMKKKKKLTQNIFTEQLFVCALCEVLIIASSQ